MHEHANSKLSGVSEVPPSPTTPTGILKKPPTPQTVYKSCKLQQSPSNADPSSHHALFVGWLWLSLGFYLFFSIWYKGFKRMNESLKMNFNHE